MKKTEKKYWQNGYSIRGEHFHQIGLSLFNYAILVSWSIKTKSLYLTQYKLVKELKYKTVQDCFDSDWQGIFDN